MRYSLRTLMVVNMTPVSGRNALRLLCLVEFLSLLFLQSNQAGSVEPAERHAATEQRITELREQLSKLEKRVQDLERRIPGAVRPGNLQSYLRFPIEVERGMSVPTSSPTYFERRNTFMRSSR